MTLPGCELQVSDRHLEEKTRHLSVSVFSVVLGIQGSWNVSPTDKGGCCC